MKLFVFLLVFLLLPIPVLGQAENISAAPASNLTADQQAQLQAAANPLKGVADFLLSNLFIYLLIAIVLLIIFIPFGIKGMRDTYKWVDDNFLKPMSGHVRVRQKLPNDRMRVFWIKPSGKLMSFVSIEGIRVESPIKLEKDYMLYEGNIPVIFLDEMNRQMKIGAAWQSGFLSQEEITRGYKNAYETGKFVGAAEFFSEIRKYLLVAIIVSFIAAGAAAYFGYEILGIVQDMKAHQLTPDEVANAVLAKLTNQTAGASGPGVNVGGK